MTGVTYNPYRVRPCDLMIRAFFNVNFESGEGMVQINRTCLASGDSCHSALPLGKGNTIAVFVIGHTVFLSGNLTESITGAVYPGL